MENRLDEDDVQFSERGVQHREAPAVLKVWQHSVESAVKCA